MAKKDRRTKGSGSIRARNKARDRWELQYLAPGPDGEMKRTTETVQGNKTHAEKVLRDRLTAIENGGYIPQQTETLGDFLGHWLTTYAATNTSPRTQQGYRGIIRRYILPAIGGVKLQNLRPQAIQGLYADMLEERELSARTVIHTHRVLREALGHAVKWGMLARNPADATTPPRPEDKGIEMWDVPTIHQFLKASEDSPHGSFYHLAVLTGMRRSELLGLQWPNVDLDGAKVHVVKTLQRIYGEGLVEGKPKTAKSRRSVALSPNAVSILKEVRTRQLEQRLAAGQFWQNTGYVFTRPDGRPVDPDDVTHVFAAVVKRAGLPHLSLHGLRHAHATLLLTNGVHLKIVSERLGHSNISITADTYSHVLPGMQEAAALGLDQRLATGNQG